MALVSDRAIEPGTLSDNGVLRRKRGPWVWGIWLVIAFVIDGAINGYLLYGQPGDQGTAVNLIVAAAIILCLLVGRKALNVGSEEVRAGSV